MRRIALFSDIHGNIAALGAVLADIAAAGVEEVFCLGDLVGYGPRPTAVIDRIRTGGIPTIMGNYDEGVGGRTGDCGCYYATEQAKSDGEASYAFTVDALAPGDHEWLAALPREIRLDHGGLRILLAHGSPRRINEYLLPDRPEKQLVRLAGAAGADVVCVGHTHAPYHRALLDPDGHPVHYVNSGSVGKPKDGDPRAGWVEVVLGGETDVRAAASRDADVGPVADTGVWIGIVVHRVEYDVRSVADEMREAGLPQTLAEALTIGA